MGRHLNALLVEANSKPFADFLSQGQIIDAMDQAVALVTFYLREEVVQNQLDH